MLNYSESDIYKHYDKGNAIYRRIAAAVGSISNKTIMNQALAFDLKKMGNTYKETIIYRIIDAVNTNRILMLYNPEPTQRLPDVLPFVKLKRDGETVVLVDISRYVSLNGDYDEDTKSGTPKYRVNVQKLHDILIPAYISLELLGPARVLPAEAIRSLANLWADLINMVLDRIGIFSNNTDRSEAFRYFSMIFYMKYYLNSPKPIIESVANSSLRNGKNPLIVQMEEAIARLDLDPYADFQAFCNVMFNSEVYSTTGLGQSITKMLNYASFVSKFLDTFGKEALSCFYSVDYFIYVLFVAYRKADIVRDRAFEYILGSSRNNQMAKLMQSLYKEVV